MPNSGRRSAAPALFATAKRHYGSQLEEAEVTS